MTKEELIIRYSGLESRGKIRFLATCSHYLTIGLRGDYDSTNLEHRIKRLMGANELQHHLSSQIGHHNNEDLKRYPDDVLINILIEKAAFYSLSHELNFALDPAAKVFSE